MLIIQNIAQMLRRKIAIKVKENRVSQKGDKAVVSVSKQRRKELEEMEKPSHIAK